MTAELHRGTPFNDYAAHYEADLAKGLAVSGEGRAYFARGRVEWLARCLRERNEAPRTGMDFGCGTGTSCPVLLELVGLESVVGVDVSPEALDAARRTDSSGRARFVLYSDYRPQEDFDLVFTNGVFHHIAPAERADVMSWLCRSLRPGGLLALWENNPWNPGTRYVMSRIPFDEDAITMWPGEARRLLRAGGFEVLSTRFLFIFPHSLRRLRPLEPAVSALPLGAQYQVLAKRV